LEGQTSSGGNKAIDNVRSFFDDVFSGRDVDKADEIIDEQFILHAPTVFADDFSGLAGIKKFVEGLNAALPNFSASITSIQDSEEMGSNYVVTHWTGMGDHEGRVEVTNDNDEVEFIEPTHAKVKMFGIGAFRISDQNRIAEASIAMLSGRTSGEGRPEAWTVMEPESWLDDGEDRRRGACHPLCCCTPIC
jgi:hypothetical protein